MEKIKLFISKYKNELLIVLGAITAIATSVATMDGNSAVFSSIVIAIVAVLVEVLQHGLTENALTLLSKAILIIIEEIKKIDTKEDATVMKASTEKELTVEDIKRRLTEI